MFSSELKAGRELSTVYCGSRMVMTTFTISLEDRALSKHPDSDGENHRCKPWM